MTRITFYRQKRFDGGIRSGIELDDLSVFEAFAPGDDESDPSLLWFVDVRVDLEREVSDGAFARDWLLEQEQAIVAALHQVAREKLSLGFDSEAQPFLESIDLPREGRLTIAVSAINRLTAREMAGELADLAAHWHSRVGELQPLSHV